MSRLIPASETCEWGTPIDLFARLHGRYQFTIDLAASHEDALLPRYYTAEQDALVHPWKTERAFCNPPYDVRSLTAFTQKAWETWVRCCNPVNGFGVFLLPCKTDQEWWHKWVWEPYLEGQSIVVRFIKGRVKYRRPGKKAGAGFPSCLVIFGGSR